MTTPTTQPAQTLKPTACVTPVCVFVFVVFENKVTNAEWDMIPYIFNVKKCDSELTISLDQTCFELIVR